MSSNFYPRFSGNTVQIFEGLSLRRTISITHKIVQVNLTGDEISIIDDKGTVHIFKWKSGALVKRI